MAFRMCRLFLADGNVGKIKIKIANGLRNKFVSLNGNFPIYGRISATL